MKSETPPILEEPFGVTTGVGGASFDGYDGFTTNSSDHSRNGSDHSNGNDHLNGNGWRSSRRQRPVGEGSEALGAEDEGVVGMGDSRSMDKKVRGGGAVVVLAIDSTGLWDPKPN